MGLHPLGALLVAAVLSPAVCDATDGRLLRPMRNALLDVLWARNNCGWSADTCRADDATARVLLSKPNTEQSSAPAAKTPTFTLDDIRTPASPGFVLLEVAPAVIQRPTTPKAFAVSLLSNVATSDNLLPSDYAVDVAPYWLTSRQELTYATYANPDIRQSVQQTLTLSLAASRASAKQVGFPDQTDLSFGIRTSLLAGKAVANTLEVTSRQYEYQVLELLLSQAREGVSLDHAILKQINQIASDPDKFLSLDPTESESERIQKRKAFAGRMTAIKEALEEGVRANDPMVQILTGLVSSSEQALERAALAVQRANRRRVGWLLDIGAASAYRIANASVGDRRRISSGLWVTPGYRAPNGRTDFVAAFRVIDRTEPIGGSVFDFGARIIHEMQDLALSIEALRRTGDPVDGRAGRERLDATFEYKVSDSLYLTASFGKGFNNTSDPSSKGGLLGVMGLSLGFGEKPTIKVK